MAAYCLAFASIASFGAIYYMRHSDITNYAAKSYTSIIQIMHEYTVKPVISNIAMAVNKFLQTAQHICYTVLECVSEAFIAKAL